MKLIDGKAVAEKIKEQLKIKVDELIDRDINPHLAAILVGDDGASQTYVAAKEKACGEVGIISTLYKYSDEITEDELLNTINFLNNDSEIHGMIVQLPLPAHISVEKVMSAIAPEKDVDGFQAVNVGKMTLGLPAYLPATPNGVIELLKYYNIETEGKHCVVMGRSHIVGLPVSIMMGQKKYPGNSTVTLCHSKTPDLGNIAATADILIVAIGQPEFVKADMVKEGAVVIDVGIHRIPDETKKSGFRLVGDVDFESVATKCSYITPVPGGVGPMTIVSLLMNTVKSASKEIYP
jgi:methylenetetrahydrofolate dehydrogenase (NADP+) / methenyltetrahydrofolate cyclohydrolase